jgi:hypothetical protein
MLFPSMASLLWGFHDVSASYRFAMGYGATLMLAWTALLLWAYQRPMERRFVAALTVLVIHGLVATELSAVISGHLAAWRMVPTWCLQAARTVRFGLSLSLGEALGCRLTRQWSRPLATTEGLVR